MPADLPPGALEEMERLLARWSDWRALLLAGDWSAEEPANNEFGALREHVYRNARTLLPALLALAREALTLRERVAGLTASLDACQAGHTHQAKRAEAAQAEAARLRAALEMTRGWLAALAYALDLDEDDTRIRVLVCNQEGGERVAMAKSLREVLDGAAAALQPAAPEPSKPEPCRMCGGKGTIPMPISGETHGPVIDRQRREEAADMPIRCPSCQGSLDNCGDAAPETKEQSHG